MHETSLDTFDKAILNALQRNAALTNAEIAGIVNLSASQCSRRRARMEADGIITGYSAQLAPEALGFGLRAITRVNLSTHSEKNAESFAEFLSRHNEVRQAYSVSGDADYVLIILARDLAAFADFIHRTLLPHPQVAQVRSEIVLMRLKDEQGLPLG
ncbi:AsnC family transcriptional regulator [Neorhizobium sp. R1-B]|uniref:Lrp/AsnC family transcriptional regulator n=1 Tax=Neorhizobium TaxID=1525371 RepID=UPI000CF84805|nr:MULTISPECIES: Lrp/AsnC family transcriptional regulator [Neorhizobium]TCV73707.1 AsnC family transcriptional regulator [Neorhizobium sp. S3-V5DH]TDX85556.1 AsnC family transcriptional regulator [Neorhizobium sp. R1-B]